MISLQKNSMRISTATQIVADRFRSGGIRQHYWSLNGARVRYSRLLGAGKQAFARHAWKDLSLFLSGSVQPIKGQTEERAKLAVDWICRAQDVNGDGGVAHGYFPCEAEIGWNRSYPETTGYIITSLLDFARRYSAPSIRERALQMARWEISIQMQNGAVQGGMVCAPEQQSPCAFNTGMVLDGWCSAYRASQDPAFLRAAVNAGTWLVNDLAQDGFFRTNGRFVTNTGVKVYNVLCAWALFRLGEHARDEKFKQAAILATEAAIGQQQPNGWFANNCLTRPQAPLLHTIGYAMQGIFEVGRLSGREDFIAAAKRSAEALLPRINPTGFIHGRFYPDWEPATFSSCLTGSAQLAVVLYGLSEVCDSPQYAEAADTLMNYLKALQACQSEDPSIVGALAGSFPIFGEYMIGGYPNWATKYLLDGLLLQDQRGSS